MTREEYIVVIAQALNDSYGNTLWEGGTDIEMATKAFNKIKNFIPVQLSTPASKKLLKQYRHERQLYYQEDSSFSKDILKLIGRR